MPRNEQLAAEIDFENSKISTAIYTSKPTVPLHNDVESMSKQVELMNRVSKGTKLCLQDKIMARQRYLSSQKFSKVLPKIYQAAENYVKESNQDCPKFNVT